MYKFRTLNADEIEVRVQQVMKSSKGYGAILLLYKTARTDANILDEYGCIWQNDFKLVNENMFGGIGIYNEEINQWIWKWDCGVESNTEKEKGEASDAFKRAGFKWGIGRELYTSPFIYVSLEDSEVKAEDGKKPQTRSVSFVVKSISYDDETRNIKTLEIVDNKNATRFTYGLSKSSNTNTKTENKTVPKEQKQEANADRPQLEYVKTFWAKGEKFKQVIKEFVGNKKLQDFSEIELNNLAIRLEKMQ